MRSITRYKALYREQLLTWEECVSLLGDYCNEVGFADYTECAQLTWGFFWCMP